MNFDVFVVLNFISWDTVSVNSTNRNILPYSKELNSIQMMRMMNILLIPITLFIYFNLVASNIVSYSKITSVTVLGNIAEVERSFSLSLNDGYSDILIPELPQNIDENSIKLKGKGSAIFLSTDLQSDHSTRASDKTYINTENYLSSSLMSLQSSFSEHQLSYDTLNQRKNFLSTYFNSIFQSVPESKSDLIALDKLTEMLDFQVTDDTKTNNKINEIKILLNQMQDKINKIQSTIVVLQRTGTFIPPYDSYCESFPCEKNEVTHWPERKESNSLRINVYVSPTKSKEPITQSFVITYFASPASWKMQYDILLDTASGDVDKYSIRFDMYASISQNTGEDWNNVRLSLSTSLPSSYGGDMAPPSPRGTNVQFVNNHMEPLHSSQMRSKSVRSELQSSPRAGYAMAAESDMMQEMAFDSSVGSTSGELGSSYVFALPHLVNVSTQSKQRMNDEIPAISSKKVNKMFIDSILVDDSVVVFSYAVPTSSTYSYLRAWGTYTGESMSKNTGIPLLSSNNARLYLEGYYAGVTNVPALQPGGDMKLNLGIDKNIDIRVTKSCPTKRTITEVTPPENSFIWFSLKQGEKKKYSVKTEENYFVIKSTHTRPHLVLLSESIPHSLEENIRVEVLSPSPSTSKIGDNKGDKDDTYDVSDLVLLSREDDEVDGSSGGGGGVGLNENDLISRVLKHQSLMQDGKNKKKNSKPTAYMWKGVSDNIVWATWMQPGICM